MHMQSQLRALNERLDNSREWLAENEAHRDEWTAETEGATLPALVAFTDSLATVRRELDAAAASVAALERLAAALETLGRLSAAIETLRDAPERTRHIRLYDAARSALEWRLSYDGPVIAATNETLALVEPAKAEVEAEIARRRFDAAEKEAARRKAEKRRKAEEQKRKALAEAEVAQAALAEAIPEVEAALAAETAQAA